MDTKKVAVWLLIIGGLNWGLIGLAGLLGNGADWNIVHKVLGSWAMLENVVYLAVGLAAVWKIYSMLGKK